ncbi:MAG TPA: hypothetical protein VMC09_08730 [Anaerolineales bacterium]|nr:hypothetical protein [Anaerolineales bacterium]
MTDQERNQVLKMIEDGKISPEEGLRLMQALEQNPPEEDRLPGGPDQATASEAGPAGTSTEKSNLENDPRIARVKTTVQRLWQIPLWIGVGITILSAVGMFLILRGAGGNFWFYFMILPLFLGIAIIALGVGTRTARWIFVDVHQKPGEKPGRIFLGFPFPLKLAAWFLRTFGRSIPDLKKTNVDEVIEVIETGFTGDQPLIVNVDEGDDGEKVQVYIG